MVSGKVKKKKLSWMKQAELYFYVKIKNGKVNKSQEIGDQVIIDFDSKGNVIGIEILDPYVMNISLNTPRLH